MQQSQTTNCRNFSNTTFRGRKRDMTVFVAHLLFSHSKSVGSFQQPRKVGYRMQMAFSQSVPGEEEVGL
jgi:hypothetical protein